MFYRLDLLAHVEVLVLDVKGCNAGEFMVYLAGEVLEFFFTALEAVAVVVADNICQSRFFYSPFDLR